MIIPPDIVQSYLGHQKFYNSRQNNKLIMDNIVIYAVLHLDREWHLIAHASVGAALSGPPRHTPTGVSPVCLRRAS